MTTRYLLSLAALSLLAGAACLPDAPESASSPAARTQTATQPLAAPDERVPAEGNYTIYSAYAPSVSSMMPARAHVDEVFGIPSFLWTHGDAPDGPSGEPSATSGGAGAALPDVQTASVAARRALARYAYHYGLSAEDLASAHIHRVHDTGQGGIIVTFGQRHAGHEVVMGRMNVLMRREDLAPVAITGALFPHARGEAKVVQSFELTPTDALDAALTDRGIAALGDAWRMTGRDAGGYQNWMAPGDVMRSPARTTRVFFPLPKSGLIPAYMLEVDLAGRHGEAPQAWRMIIDARDGRLLLRSSLIAHQSYEYRVWADEDGVPYANPFDQLLKPYVPGTLPNFQPPRIITTDGFNTRGDVWLAAGSTRTLGNHAAAYADVGGRDGFDGDDIFAETSAPQTFDWRYDFEQAPGADDTQTQAGIVQMFYTIQYMHDLFYPHGFDEKAGNAQEDNYGRGGAAGDRLLAESLDFSGTNNANMLTPADGASPRMQMYRFTYSSADRVEVLTPASIAGPVTNIGDADFPEFFDLSADIVAADDDTSTTTDACEAITNTAEIAGKIALIDRGNCTFLSKVLNAQQAGAAGVLIANDDIQRPDRTFNMGGFDASATIPSAMISYNRGQTLRGELANGPVEARLLALQDQDAALDGDIVTHEWGHYAFGRLTQARGSTTQLGGINEGNSDFVALLFAARSEDTMVAGNESFQGLYPVGQYAGHRYLTGVRRIPYTTDMSINPLTFRHISDREALPPSVPRGSANSEVHNSGEIWALSMWECHTALIEEHGFDVAKERMLGYLVAGLKLFPRDATFIEARDAILAAMRAQNEDDFRTCFYTFAKRGMGVGSRAPGRYAGGNVGVVESFEVGGALEVQSLTLTEDQACDDDGYLDVGETGEVTLQVVNVGAEALTDVSVRIEAYSNGNPTITRRGVSYPEGDTVTVASLEPFGVADVTVPLRLDEAIGSDLLSFRVTADHPDVQRRAEAEDGVLVNTDVEMASSRLDTVEFGQGDWTIDRDPQLMNGEGWTIAEVQGDRRWSGAEEEFQTDIWLETPPLAVAQDADFVLRFEHRHNFEVNRGAWDGGVIEIKTGSGPTWRDITSVGADAGYTGVLANATDFGGDAVDNNPLVGRSAYTGLNPSYPDLDRVAIDLGDAVAGQIVSVRFRIGTDRGTGGDGWQLDNIAFEGIDNTPFAALIDEQSRCGEAVAVLDAQAGVDRTARAGETVTLDGSASSGEDFSVTWTQTAGPEVTLQNTQSIVTSFAVPQVAASTELAFTLTLRDGAAEASDEIIITASPANRAPVASIAVDEDVVSGAVVTLDGAQTRDPDGDALTYIWSQVGGPGASLSDAGAVAPTFVAPQVEDATDVTFQLIASDGALLSDPVQTTITIFPPDEAPIDEEDAEGGRANATGTGCAAAPGPQTPAAPILILAGIGISGWVRRRR